MGRDCHRIHGGDGKSKRKPYGCMASLYHLFDFHSHHHHLTIDSPSRSKGLKLIEESDKLSLSVRVRPEIETKSLTVGAFETDDSSTSSPGSKTPNLVARLMGLDLLRDKPDLNHSLTNLHTMSRHRHYKKDTRSLPVSPRISSVRKSDFEIHRLSLQLNKESKQDLEEENRSPRHYARQIVKQIKERVVTRSVVGMDITNSVKNRDGRRSHELRRDTTVSCSPRRSRFSDKENKPNTIHKTNYSSSFRPEKITQKPKPTSEILVSASKASTEKQSQNRVKEKQLKPINICKKTENETRFTQRPVKPSRTLNIRTKQQEGFLSESTDVKAKALQKKLPNISASRPTEKQITQIGRPKSSQDTSICYKTEKNNPKEARNYNLENAATIKEEPIGVDTEKDYITRIMNLAGIKTDSLTTFSSSSPSLDPSIFRKLEHLGETSSGPLALQCNRRLLFDLVNEILIEIVEKRRKDYHKGELIDEFSSYVARYSNSSECCPVSKERALMDVDHLGEKKIKEEREKIIREIERDIIDSLVRETVSECRVTK